MPVPDVVPGSNIELRSAAPDCCGHQCPHGRAWYGAWDTNGGGDGDGFYLYKSWSKSAAARMVNHWRKVEDRRRRLFGNGGQGA